MGLTSRQSLPEDTPASCPASRPASGGEGSATLWFPPAVRAAFAAALKARSHRQHARLSWLSKKFRKRFPAYAAYLLELEGCDRRDWGRQEEALALFRQAEAISTFQEPSLGVNITAVLLELDRPREAAEALKPWLARFSHDPALLRQGCRVLMAQGRYGDALKVLDTADPDHASAECRYEAADCLRALGRFRESVAAYAEAARLSEHFSHAWHTRIFIAHYAPDLDAEALAGVIREWREACPPPPPTPPEYLERVKNADKTLRIGLFSPGFNMHPVGWMASRSLWFLSKLPDCELYFYALSPGLNKEDPVRSRCKAAAAKWIDASGWNLDRLYRNALKDRLDIAVDLAGHGEGCVLPLFARRIAPIQIKWVGGLFSTTGAPNMDYLLSDRFETPDGCDDAYTENLVRLPYSYISYHPADIGDTEREPDLPGPSAADALAAPQVTPRPGQPLAGAAAEQAGNASDNTFGATPDNLSEPPIRFASFNNIYKVNGRIVSVWAAILSRVPESTLMLKGNLLQHEETQERIRGLFAAHGIAADRLELEGPSNYADLMRTYRRVDIALDTWPYTGGLTTLEALWMGVPVVTTPGPSFAGRHALSHLRNLGLDSFVASDFDEYVSIAVSLAGNRALLRDLRILLPYSVLTSPIVRHEQLAADLHTAFRAMWERHCAGLPPVPMRFEQPSPIPEAFAPFLKTTEKNAPES